jgi:hypothetical protein
MEIERSVVSLVERDAVDALDGGVPGLEDGDVVSDRLSRRHRAATHEGQDGKRECSRRSV